MLIAGYDLKRGPGLYWLDYLASSTEVPFSAHGYGAYYCLSIMDRYHNHNISVDEAIDIIKKLKNKQIIKISILDSYLLLPVSLDFLCKVFNTNVKKSILHYDFITKDTIYYKGDVPDFKYFNKVLTIEDYNKFKNELIFKNESKSIDN